MSERTITTDVIDELTLDHREATLLLEQIPVTRDPERCRDLADIAIAEIMRHAVAEEMFVYPAMSQHLADGDEAVRHDIAEHQDIEEVMLQLEAVDATDERFDILVRTLTEKLRHHVHDEEHGQFPRLRAELPHEELVALAEKVNEAKLAAPTRPHPSTPRSPMLHEVAGTGAGMVDRMRDWLTSRAN